MSLPRQRRVVSWPLAELWDDSGTALPLRRGPALGAAQVEALLTRQTCRLVVAEAGQPLLWVAPQQGFDYWQTEVRSHLVEPAPRRGKAGRWWNSIEDFADEYCFQASQWSASEDDEVVVILFEREN